MGRGWHRDRFERMFCRDLSRGGENHWDLIKDNGLEKSLVPV